jgi:Family of unknown function (DUF6498)
MIKKRLSKYDWLLVIANLIPVYGVWFLGWHPTEAFIVYATETMIAGVFTVLKLLIATVVRKKDTFLFSFLLYIMVFSHWCKQPCFHKLHILPLKKMGSFISF